MRININNKKTRLILTALLSASIYGGWAYYVNYGSELLFLTVIIQVTCSFIAGYFVATIVEKVFSLTAPPWRYPIASLAPYSITLLLFACIHHFVGTEHILKTLLPNIIIGTGYFLIYCNTLETLFKTQKTELCKKEISA